MLKFFKRCILSAASYSWKVLLVFIGIRIPSKQAKNILFIPRTGIGDLILTIPMLQSLKQHFPSAKITVVVSPRGGANLLIKNEYVDKLVEYDFAQGGLKDIVRFVRARVPKGYTHSFNTFGLRGSIFAFFAKAEFRVSFLYEMGWDKTSNFLNSKGILLDSGIHEVEQYFRLLIPVGIFPTGANPSLKILSEEKEWAKEFLRKNGFSDRKRPLIGFHIGSYRDQIEKRWDKDKYFELAKLFLRETRAMLLFIGGEEERREIKEMLKLLDSNAIDASGLPIRQTASVIQQCDIFISNDGGPMHIAAALDISLIAIFGPTDPKRTGPRGSKIIVLKSNIDCSPCYQMYLGPIRCIRDGDCMKQISVEDVYNASLRLLRDKN